jgi:hypothetical protein
VHKAQLNRVVSKLRRTKVVQRWSLEIGLLPAGLADDVTVVVADVPGPKV